MTPFAIAGVQMHLQHGDNLEAMRHRLHLLMHLYPWVQMAVFSELCVFGPSLQRWWRRRAARRPQRPGDRRGFQPGDNPSTGLSRARDRAGIPEPDEQALGLQPPSAGSAAGSPTARISTPGARSPSLAPRARCARAGRPRRPALAFHARPRGSRAGCRACLLDHPGELDIVAGGPRPAMMGESVAGGRNLRVPGKWRRTIGSLAFLLMDRR